MPLLAGARVRTRMFAVALIALALGLAAIWAAPAHAIMVKLPHGGYANYEPITGAKAPKAAKIFDAAFTNLDYSGGPVMPSNTNYSIVWRPSNYGGTPFQTGYAAGVDQFFADMAADSGQSSNSDAVSIQYNDASGHVAAYNFTNGGQIIDTDPLPANGCPANPGDVCLSDPQLQAELNAFLASHHLPADFTHEYYLLTPPDVASCFDSAGSTCSGNADQNPAFCAYHSQTSAGYIYSNIPDLAGLDGCDPYASNWFDCPNFSCSYNNSPADGVLSAISHEHNESITDPQPNNAWTDWGSNVGGEIGDKCNNDAFSDPNLGFTGSNSDQPFNEVINGDDYLIQREWSNQTQGCLDSFTPNGTSAHAAFTSSHGAGNAVSFNASGSVVTGGGGAAEYVWQFNDGPGQTGTIETTSPTITHTFPAPGNYTVALTVMAADGTSNGTANPVTAGSQPPTASFSAPSGVESSPLTFDGRASSDPNSGGSITSYAWNFGDGTTGSGAVALHTYAHFGTYTATLTVTDNFGQANTVARTVTVLPDETPTASFAPPSGGTAGHPVTFTGSGSDPDGFIVAYSWSFGDGASASGASVSHAYSAPGTYGVTLIVFDSSGKSAAVSHEVIISVVHPTNGSCVVPKLKGKTLAQAKAALKKAHCGLGKLKQSHKPKHGAGAHKTWELVVSRQSIPAGRLESKGTKVGLTLVYKAVKAHR